MAKRSRTSSPISNFDQFTSNDASVDAAWREALAYRDIGNNERVKSQKRLAQAQVVRAQAESEAITSTKNYCVDARAQADDNLAQADLTLSKAERIRSDALEWQASMEEEIQFRLDDAARIRANARAYAEKLEGSARGAADALMDQTRVGAEELATRMRSDSAEDIRKVLADIEVARASAEDELETQRLLSETARVRAFSAGLTAEVAQEADAPVEFTPAPRKKATKASTAKKRSSKSTSARKAA
ncbi:MAG: hypothetical protein HOJ22_02915 [Chloroflexi bacterium]|jgi:hypothetical protein|nr:hypothetical protein [Chloroflexota bacterium]MBT5627219.1 hypothetical protein [Chloroflexota bacterium]